MVEKRVIDANIDIIAESGKQDSLRASAAYIAEAEQRLRDVSGFDEATSLTWAEWPLQIKTG